MPSALSLRAAVALALLVLPAAAGAAAQDFPERPVAFGGAARLLGVLAECAGSSPVRNACATPFASDGCLAAGCALGLAPGLGFTGTLHGWIVDRLGKTYGNSCSAAAGTSLRVWGAGTGASCAQPAEWGSAPYECQGDVCGRFLYPPLTLHGRADPLAGGSAAGAWTVRVLT